MDAQEKKPERIARQEREITVPMVSNRDTYLAIAKEALGRALETEATHTQRLPNGSAGTVSVRDPEQASFKQSLIAIVFAGVYLDAFLSVAKRQQRRLRANQPKSGRKRKRSRKSRNRYASALETLGITDPEIVAASDRFKDARDHLVHEQPLTLGPGKPTKVHIAQREAEHAVSFIQIVTGRWVARQLELRTADG